MKYNKITFILIVSNPKKQNSNFKPWVSVQRKLPKLKITETLNIIGAKVNKLFIDVYNTYKPILTTLQ